MLELTLNEGFFREALEDGFNEFVEVRKQARTGDETYEDHDHLTDISTRVASESPHVYERFRQEGQVPHVRLFLQFQQPRGMYRASFITPREVSKQAIDQRHFTDLGFNEVTDENRAQFVEQFIRVYSGQTLSNESVRLRLH